MNILLGDNCSHGGMPWGYHDSSGRLASVYLGVVREGFTEKVRHELTFEGGI